MKTRFLFLGALMLMLVGCNRPKVADGEASADPAAAVTAQAEPSPDGSYSARHELGDGGVLTFCYTVKNGRVVDYSATDDKGNTVSIADLEIYSFIRDADAVSVFASFVQENQYHCVEMMETDPYVSSVTGEKEVGYVVVVSDKGDENGCWYDR
ncbi:MAG: hypothetical protein IJ760_02705 [Bacteroidales bacterium]|nr:hypothetical protein [Bacteroidales bacterium]